MNKILKRGQTVVCINDKRHGMFNISTHLKDDFLRHGAKYVISGVSSPHLGAEVFLEGFPSVSWAMSRFIPVESHVSRINLKRFVHAV